MTLAGLLGSGELRAIDLLFLLEHVSGNVLALDVARIGGRDVHRDLLRQHLEILGARDEVGLAIHFDEHPELATHVDVVGDDAVLRRPTGAFRH